MVRQRSVPLEGGGLSEQASNPISAELLTVPAHPSKAIARAAASSSHGVKLLHQADALAKMTLELNLRAVNAQAERIERDLRALVACTAQDKKFREENENRMQEVWREVLAVKARMSEVKGAQDDIHADFERCQKETERTASMYQEDMAGLKQMVDEVSEGMKRVPPPRESRAEPTPKQTPKQTPTRGAQTRAMARARRQEGTAKESQSPDKASRPIPAQQRIREALASTRRWNDDHKKTIHDDSKFVANYLRQQGKRDPGMAGFIQRELQKRVRSRLPESSRMPTSLDEFCLDVNWKDVAETVEDVLVRNQARTSRSLR